MAITAFGALLFSHLFADFTLQTDWIAENKQDNNIAFWSHIGIHSFISFLTLWYVTTPIAAMVGCLLYTVSHAVIDSIKPRPKINVDQSLHLTAISVISVGLMYLI